MLSYLRIKDFALVEDIEISLCPGLNVLTGETGAGKSILINAISLLIGERAATEMIRQGAEKAYLESVFFIDNKKIHSLLDDLGIETSEELIVSREVTRSGRSLCRINGNLVPVNHLKKIGGALVDMHGQFQHQSLLRNDNQLFILDELEKKSKALREQLEGLVKKRRQLSAKLKELGSSHEERRKRMELLAYQLSEIKEANLSEEEEEYLLNRERILNNIEKLINTTKEAFYSIYEGNHQQLAVVDILAGINRNLENLQEIDEELSNTAANLKNIEILLIDTAREIKNYTDNLFVEPEEKNKIEERLQVYRKLKGKYGSSTDEVLTYYNKVQEELTKLQNSTEEAEELEQKLADLDKEINEQSASLSRYRRENAEQLTKLLHASFKEVALEKGQFAVNVSQMNEVSATGKDKVEFLFSANPGENLLPLNKIISGGEMSRVMLALKSVLAGKDSINTLIFDEIDSGIGGVVAQKISEKLKETAKYHQVICVTHNPQIAAKAHHHFQLYKEIREERTSTNIKKLDSNARVEEIARMLDGNVNEISLAHAHSLLANNNKDN